MKINLIIENERIVGYQTFPISENLPVYEIDDIPEDLTNGEYGILNNKIVKLGYTKEQLKINEEKNLETKRQKRKTLLEAFDKWEKAVLRGRMSENASIMNWYEKLLNLEDSAFETIPSEIEYFLDK